MSRRNPSPSGIAAALGSLSTLSGSNIDSVQDIATSGSNLAYASCTDGAPPIHIGSAAYLVYAQFNLQRPGTPGSASIRAAVWADSAGQPGALLAVSAPVLQESLPASIGLVTFGFGSQPIANLGIWVGLVATAPMTTLQLTAGARSGASTWYAASEEGPWTELDADVAAFITIGFIPRT